YPFRPGTNSRAIRSPSYCRASRCSARPTRRGQPRALSHRPARVAGHPRRAALLSASHFGQGGSTMKVYQGSRTPEGCVVTVCQDGGEPRPLALRLDLRNHSPTGAEWGYAGSGPAQLALALAADVLGDDDRTQAVYQQLKFKLIGGLPKEGWELTEDR